MARCGTNATVFYEGVAFFASKGTRQPVAPRMTCLPAAGDCFAILRNLCHRVFENKFSDSVSQIPPTCGCASIVWSSLGCSGRSSSVQYLFVGLSGYGKNEIQWHDFYISKGYFGHNYDFFAILQLSAVAGNKNFTTFVLWLRR